MRRSIDRKVRGEALRILVDECQQLPRTRREVDVLGRVIGSETAMLKNVAIRSMVGIYIRMTRTHV